MGIFPYFAQEKYLKRQRTFTAQMAYNFRGYSNIFFDFLKNFQEQNLESITSENAKEMLNKAFETRGEKAVEHLRAIILHLFFEKIDNDFIPYPATKCIFILKNNRRILNWILIYSLSRKRVYWGIMNILGDFPGSEIMRNDFLNKYEAELSRLYEIKKKDIGPILDDLIALGYLNGDKNLQNHYLKPHSSIILLSLLEYFIDKNIGLYTADFNELRNIGFTRYWKLTDDLQYSILLELKNLGALKIEQTGNLNQISLKLRSIDEYFHWLEKVF